jgi:hypothetical protein
LLGQYWGAFDGHGAVQAGQLQNFFTPIFTTSTASVATGSVEPSVISTDGATRGGAGVDVPI